MYPWTHTILSQEATRNTQSTLNRTKIIINSTQMGSKSQIDWERTFADRSYAIATPKLWNQLPAPLKEITSNEIFKKQLKTYLFHEAFNQY